MKLYRVDAFTGDLFKGNPAGLCILDQQLGEEVKYCHGNESF